MLKKIKQSLALKTVLPVLLVLLVSIGGMSAYLYINNVEKVEENLSSKSEALSETLHFVLKNSMIKQDVEGLNAIIKYSGGISGINSVYIADTDGRIWASSGDKQSAKPIEKGLLEEVSGANRSLTRLEKNVDSTYQIACLRPIPNEKACSNASCHGGANRIIGFIGVNMSADSAFTELKHQQIRQVVLFMIIVFFIGAMMIILSRLLVSKPLKGVTETAKGIAEGRLSQEAIKMEREDEIGQLSLSFNLMLSELKRLVEEAGLISKGVIGASEIEEKLARNYDLAYAVEEFAKSRNTGGDLAKAFVRMQTELCKLAVQARRIADDDLHNPALDVDIQGELGGAFRRMTANLRELAVLAEKIAEGDLTAAIKNRKGVLMEAFVKILDSQKDFSKTAMEIADGNLAVAVKPRSENDVLAVSFSIMVRNLNELIVRINAEAGQVNAVSHQLKQLADQISGNSKQLAQATTHVAKAASDVAQSAQSASSSGNQAQELSIAGKKTMHELLQKVDGINNSMNVTAKNIERLVNRSNEIAEMTNAITDIADQTNLLSLNAAIEAARAGEHGRGFAVVASEIRKLADNSQQKSQKIAKIINDIIADTLDTRQSISQESENINTGMALIESANSIFQEIAGKIDNIAGQMEQIAANSEETSASAEEISAQAEQQNAKVEEMTASAEQLKSVAENLHANIEKFRVK
ncbi:MAG: HAMP domain-containing protein [Planctomycetes bacterium]|nr:HAMP domain-containing protein [Planctomycetota bacterium]